MLRSESVAGDQAGVSCVNLDEGLSDRTRLFISISKYVSGLTGVRLGVIIRYPSGTSGQRYP